MSLMVRSLRGLLIFALAVPLSITLVSAKSANNNLPNAGVVPRQESTVRQTLASDLSQQRFELERERLKLETHRLAMDEKSRIFTLFAVIFPLFGTWLTLSTQTRNAFELKAAELVLGAASPWAAEGRAAVLQQLFPRRLPRDFAMSFDKNNFPGVRKYEMKIEILRQIVEHPERKDTILDHWQQAFQGDAWIAELRSSKHHSVNSDSSE